MGQFVTVVKILLGNLGMILKNFLVGTILNGSEIFVGKIGDGFENIGGENV